EFRTRWARHDVRYHNTGKKPFHHPVVGDLELAFEGMTFVADPELTMFAFTAEPGSKSEEALKAARELDGDASRNRLTDADRPVTAGARGEGGGGPPPEPPAAAPG